MNDLTKGRVSVKILNFAWPLLIGSIVQQMYNIVDRIIVGKYINTEALAAVGASFYIIFAFISLTIGIASGGTIVVAQYFGAKKYDKVRRTVDTIYIFFFFTSLVISGLGIVFSESIFRLINLPEELMPQAVIYLRIYLAGIITAFGYNGTSAILRGMGDSMRPLVFTIIASVLNIVLDLFFVRVMGWGVASVAVATIIAQLVAFLTAVIYLNKKHKLINISFRKYVFDTEIFKQFLRIGLPSGIQHSFVAFAMTFLNGIINNFGTVVLAAFSAASIVDGMAMQPAMVFAMALSSFAGQNLGANEIERVKQGVKFNLAISSVVSLLVTIVIVFFGNNIMGWFTNDPSVIKVGEEYLVIVSSFYLVFNAMFTFNGVLRGAGDTIIPMFITLVSLWGLRIPLALILSKHLGANGIWWSIPIAWTFGMLASFVYYLSGNWKKKGVVKHTMAQTA